MGAEGAWCGMVDGKVAADTEVNSDVLGSWHLAC